jgi:hypothetical protein
VAVAHPLALDAPRHDALGVDADQGTRPGQRLGPPADLDPARLPWGQHVVDDDGGPPGGADVAVLLGAVEADPLDLDRTVICEAPADRGDVRRPVRAHRREAGQAPLALQVGELTLGERAHDAPPLTPILSGRMAAPLRRTVV